MLMDVSVSRRMIVRVPGNVRMPNTNVRVDVMARNICLCAMNSHRCISFCGVMHVITGKSLWIKTKCVDISSSLS